MWWGPANHTEAETVGPHAPTHWPGNSVIQQPQRLTDIFIDLADRHASLAWFPPRPRLQQHRDNATTDETR